MLSAKSLHALALLSLVLVTGYASAADQPVALDPVTCIKPEYRERWINAGLDGRVTLAITIDANGKPSDTKIVESSGNSDIDRASARAAQSCSFKAALRDGNAVPGLTHLRYSWVVQ